MLRCCTASPSPELWSRQWRGGAVHLSVCPLKRSGLHGLARVLLVNKWEIGMARGIFPSVHGKTSQLRRPCVCGTAEQALRQSGSSRVAAEPVWFFTAWAPAVATLDVRSVARATPGSRQTTHGAHGWSLCSLAQSQASHLLPAVAGPPGVPVSSASALTSSEPYRVLASVAESARV